LAKALKLMNRDVWGNLTVGIDASQSSNSWHRNRA